MADQLYFQWQNEFLLKTIYPLRELKLRDFLTYYAEIDIWAQYKGKEAATLPEDVQAYTKAQETLAITAYKTYSTLRNYFSQPDVRVYYAKFQPMDETELKAINDLHNLFITSLPNLKETPDLKEALKEKDVINDQLLSYWVNHRNILREQLKGKQIRHENMDPNHPKYAQEGQELTQFQNITMPMAEQELAQLRAFASALEGVEKYKLQVTYTPDQPITVEDLTRWRVAEYKASIAQKNQAQLLEEVVARFRKEPDRYPLWLQYMVIHFSGMRYASAHGSWADPKDLLVRLRSAKVDQDTANLDDDTVAKMCADKVTLYESSNPAGKPKLALASEKEWQDKVAMDMLSVKAPGPKTRRAGLIALLKDEISYETVTLTTDQALSELIAIKATFPKWAWKEIVKLTQLRVNQVTDLNWEKLTPEDEQDRYSQQYNDIRAIMDAWENYDWSAWREEHGRTHELIVTRAVCNETAEHIQHMRGYLPPGGLTPRPKWYLNNEAENKLPGDPRPYFSKPKSMDGYTEGASILWLRFQSQKPDEVQIAKAIKTKDGVGLLPDTFKAGKPNSKTVNAWVYQIGETVTRTRTTVNPDKTRTVEQQYLRWIHEATVALVTETVDGPVMLTFETALPDSDPGLSAVGMFKEYPDYLLSDGKEDNYNRSFVGYVPPGQLPMDDIKRMLDWNKILLRQVA